MTTRHKLMAGFCSLLTIVWIAAAVLQEKEAPRIINSVTAAIFAVGVLYATFPALRERWRSGRGSNGH